MEMWMFRFMIKFCLVWWVKPFDGRHSQIMGSKPFIVGNVPTLGLCCTLSVLMKVAECPDTKFIECISCDICSPLWTKHFQNTQYASEFESGWKYVSPDLFCSYTRNYTLSTRASKALIWINLTLSEYFFSFPGGRPPIKSWISCMHKHEIICFTMG
jgi:hypothetical protein